VNLCQAAARCDPPVQPSRVLLLTLVSALLPLSCLRLFPVLSLGLLRVMSEVCVCGLARL